MAKPMLSKNRAFLRAPSKSDILPSVLLFLASRASFMGAFPFGAAFFASCSDKSAAYLGITVMYLGLLSAGAAGSAVKYMMSALIFWLFINLYSRRSRRLEAAVCGASMFASGMASMLYSFAGAYDIFLLLAESAACGVMYVVFSGARESVIYGTPQTPSEQERLLCLSAAAGVFILGLGKTELPFDISVANIMAVYTVLMGANCSGLAGAAVSGVAVGFITGGGSSVMMAGAMGLSALFGGFLKSLGRFGTAIGFLAGAYAVLLYSGSVSDIPYSALDALIGAAAFTATPPLVHKKLSSLLSAERRFESPGSAERLRVVLSERLKRCAAAFRRLDAALASSPADTPSASAPRYEEIFSETAGRICGDCPRRQRCWDKDTDKTIKGMSELLNVIETKGSAEINSMPLSFRERCLRPERMLLEFSHVYELYKLRLSHNSERKLSREASAAQYRETAELFESLSHELDEELLSVSELENDAAAALENAGAAVYEIRISENDRTEVFLRLDSAEHIGAAENILSDVLDTNICFDREANGGIYFVSKPRFTVDVGMTQLSKEESCGDTVSVFAAGCRLCCIICDGMGTGEKAARGSSEAAGLLREFLEAGFGVRTAVDAVNSSLSVSFDDDYFTTLDLLCIDLMNGSAEFFKIGAAQSLIYRRGSVETVFSAAFPIGAAPFTEVLPQLKRIEDGEIIVMASDGITEAGEIKTEWLKKQIKTPVLSMQAMTDEITERALERSGGVPRDDMSVIALKITEE